MANRIHSMIGKLRRGARRSVSGGRPGRGLRLALVAITSLGLMFGASVAEAETPAERGYRLLRTKPLLPAADFDRETFDALWTVWPEPLRSRAEKATPAERRKLMLARYGLHDLPYISTRPTSRANEGISGSPGGTAAAAPASSTSTASNATASAPLADPLLGYTLNGEGGWVMNCFSCHGGKVNGTVIPGSPNSHFALETLMDDVRLTKLAKRKRLNRLDVAQLTIPLGTTVGTTNAVIFGVALEALRDKDMNVDRSRPMPKLIHHDMDAPAWWNYRKRKTLYADGYAAKNHRMLMQFILVPSNGPKALADLEESFRDIEAYLMKLEPPKYPFPIDRKLAALGETAFVKNCASCHGTYGPRGKYDQKIISLDVIGTDPVRFQSIQREQRQWASDSWLSFYGQQFTIPEAEGYVAPPLDGIWASAPYFHNGSVPTLWHVLNPADRPLIWKRTDEGYDQERVGLEVKTYTTLPGKIGSRAESRRYFQTSKLGKSAAGHLFPNRLTEAEKRAVLEYLKTL